MREEDKLIITKKWQDYVIDNSKDSEKQMWRDFFQNCAREPDLFYINETHTLSINANLDIYSPLYEKHFRDMTDEEIKLQLDYWVATGQHMELFEERKEKTFEEVKKDYRDFISKNRKGNKKWG
jgi:hypothetical protein